MALSDIFGVIRGIQIVIKAAIEESSLKTIMRNSSLKFAAEEYLKMIKNMTTPDLNKNYNEFLKTFLEGGDRFYAICIRIDQIISSPINQSTTEDQFKPTKNSMYEIKLTPHDQELLDKLDMKHREKLETTSTQSIVTNINAKSVGKKKVQKNRTNIIEVQPNLNFKRTISATAKQRKVPSTRIARIASFGSLVAGLGVGTAAEFMRRTVGLRDSTMPYSNIILTKANMNRITNTLCKVRGAALKVGQILSVQDESIVNPVLIEALERVRASADFMPIEQVEEVMHRVLGKSWRGMLSHFEEIPFAAASIGQVHFAITTTNKGVAIKIQYPGVAKGIKSDIDNMMAIMKIWNVFPKGMFIDNVVEIAKRELAWEVDYAREAECTKRFKQLLQPHHDYYVPEVMDQLCSSQVFTAEYVEGIAIDQCANLDIEHRKFIANKMLELCLLELMVFRYMQTDPNWANFFYNSKTKKIILLDFGSSREYSKPFVDKYIKIIKAATENDRETVLKVSRELGFLTGYENKVMENAHTDVVMLLGEVFQYDDYNFNGRKTIENIQNLVLATLNDRLCPMPDEVYSLHRKLSGIYSLCAKLDAPVSTKSLFNNFYDNYKFDAV